MTRPWSPQKAPLGGGGVLRLLTLLALSALAAAHSMSGGEGGRNWECIHDHVHQPEAQIAPQSYRMEQVVGVKGGGGEWGADRRQADTWQPIRIAIYNAMGTSMTQDKVDYVLQLLRDSDAWFKSALNVRPVQGNLFVPRRCASTWVTGSRAGQCFQALPASCGTMTEIPAEHMDGITLATSPDGNSYKTVVLPKGTGIPNADLVIYATAGTDPGGSSSNNGGGCGVGSNTLAYSGSCYRDQNDRPVVGYIHFCSEKVQPSTVESVVWEDRVLAAHEMTHIIGFSASSFPLFRKPDNTPYLARCPEAPGCSAADVDGNPPNIQTMEAPASVVSITQERGGTVARIVTPMVKQVTHLHYGCAALDGAELENFGGTATAGSHWEKRALMSEYMTGSTSDGFRSVYSAFTLAALHDSGWYRVNWEAAGALLWGRNWGCDLALKPCLPEDSGAPSPTPTPVAHFCQSEAANGHQCTFDRRAIGFCSVVRFPDPLPTQYQYFTDPRVGGIDSLMDFCPINLPYENKYCDNSNGLAEATDCGGEDCFGSVYEAGSGCFQTSLVLTDYNIPGMPATTAGCYKYSCKDGHLIIQVPGGAALNCSVESSKSAPGFTGRLYCPPTEEVCFDQTAFVKRVESMAPVNLGGASIISPPVVVNAAPARHGAPAVLLLLAPLLLALSLQAP